MILEVRHLRALEAISSEGSVSKAAARLHLTQPAVSHALRSLEERLGVRLFERRKNGMVPTPQGERLLRTASSVLGELEQVERELVGRRDGELHILRMATQCYSCYHWLPGVLRLFMRRFPEIDVEIVPGAARRTAEALAAGELDIAIVTSGDPLPGAVIETLFSDEMVAITAPHHELARRTHLEASDFADQHLVVHPDSDTSFFFTEVLNPAGVRPSRVSEFPLTEAVVQTVKAGLGVSVAPRWAVAPELAAGNLRAVPLTAGGLRTTWYSAVAETVVTVEAVKELLYHFKCCAFV